MKNLLKEVNGNIYGLGVYCFKDEEGKIIYCGSGMINDRLQSHLYNLKRGFYEDTNKDILQKKYNLGLLSFEVLHFSENNSEYLHMTDKEKQAVQKALEVMEQFYVNLYRDTICNKQMVVKKFSTSPSRLSTYKRRMANIGNKNPNCLYDEKIIAEVLWLKLNDYKPKEISQLIEENYGIDINSKYISAIGLSKWIHIEGKKPNWVA